MTTGEPVFRMFENFQQWVNKGTTWIHGGVCIDKNGKILKNGGDMKTAKYPIAIMHHVGKKAASVCLTAKNEGVPR